MRPSRLTSVLVLLLALVAVSGATNPSIVASSYVRGDNTTFTQTYTVAITAGWQQHTLIECANGGGRCFDSITDNVGSAYKCFALAPSSSSWHLHACVAYNVASGSANTRVVTLNNHGGFIRMISFLVQDGATSDGIRSFSWGSGSSGTLAATCVNTAATCSSTALTTVSGDLVIGFGFTLGGSITAGSGYSSMGATDGFYLGESKTAASTTETPTMTGGSNTWSFIGYAIAPSAVGSPNTNVVTETSKYREGVTSLTSDSITTTAGNGLIAWTRLCCISTVPTMTTSGITWKQAGCATGGGTASSSCIFYAENIPGGAMTAAMTWGGSSRNADIIIREYSNVPTSNWLRWSSCRGDNCNTSNATGVDPAVAPTASGDLIAGISYFRAAEVYAPPVGWNGVFGNQENFDTLAYDNLGSGSAMAPLPIGTGSGSSLPSQAAVASFKTNSSGTSPIVQGRTCLTGSATSCAYPNPVTSGNTLVTVSAGENTSNCATSWFTDTLSAGFTVAVSDTCTGCTQARFACIANAVAPSTSAETVTVTGTGGNVYVAVMELSGAGSSVLGTSSTLTVPPSLPSITASGTNMVTICAIDGDQAKTITPSDVSLNQQTMAFGVKFVTSGTQTCSGNNGSVGVFEVIGSATVTTRRAQRGVY